jgi:hypothetical protein
MDSRLRGNDGFLGAHLRGNDGSLCIRLHGNDGSLCIRLRGNDGFSVHPPAQTPWLQRLLWCLRVRSMKSLGLVLTQATKRATSGWLSRASAVL